MYYNSATGDVQNDFMEPLIPEIKDCYTDVPYKINKEKYFELFEKEVAKRNIITNRLKKNVDVVQFTFGITIDDKEKPTARSLFVWPKNLKTYDVFIFHQRISENNRIYRRQISFETYQGEDRGKGPAKQRH